MVDFLFATGYYSYVEVDKTRTVYSKNEDNLRYNVMLDIVRDVGGFVEFEILCDDENRKIEILKEKLNKFVNKFKIIGLEVADLPYRDFVARKLFEKISNNCKVETLLLDLDGTAINSEREFFQSFSDVIYNRFNYEIKLQEYIDNELNKDSNLINYLKSNKIVPDSITDSEIMEDVYYTYGGRFKNVIHDKDTLVNIEVIKQLKAMGIKIGLVSTCKRIYINQLIEELQIGYLFDCIIAREDVRNLKPNKEGYEKAIELLKANKSTTIVVEDANRGFIAARDAKLNVVGVDKFSLKSNRDESVKYVNSFTSLALIILNNI